MGYIRHNAIVVTSWNGEAIAACADKARDLGLRVICENSDATNGYRSLLVCPDGSKEGWAESDAHDAKRGELKAWMATQRYEDASSSLEWVEVAYGSDDAVATVEAHEWQAPNYN